MAILDENEFLLNYIQNAFITSDKTELSEVILVAEGNYSKEKCSNSNPSVDSELSNSPDIYPDMEITGHRFRSYTAQKMEKLYKERKEKSKIEHITWNYSKNPNIDHMEYFKREEVPNSNFSSVSNVTGLEDNKSSNTKPSSSNKLSYSYSCNISNLKRYNIKPLNSSHSNVSLVSDKLDSNVYNDKDSNNVNSTAPSSKRTSKLSQLIFDLQKRSHNVSDQFSEYSKFDAKTLGNGVMGSKKLEIFLTMVNSKNRPYPITVVVSATAKIMDLIGLICWQYTLEEKSPPLQGDIDDYNLYIVEDNGEIDHDFPPLDKSEPAIKFAFPKLALVYEPSAQLEFKPLSPTLVKNHIHFNENNKDKNRFINLIRQKKSINQENSNMISPSKILPSIPLNKSNRKIIHTPRFKEGSLTTPPSEPEHYNISSGLKIATRGLLNRDKVKLLNKYSSHNFSYVTINENSEHNSTINKAIIYNNNQRESDHSEIFYFNKMNEFIEDSNQKAYFDDEKEKNFVYGSMDNKNKQGIYKKINSLFKGFNIGPKRRHSIYNKCIDNLKVEDDLIKTLYTSFDLLNKETLNRSLIEKNLLNESSMFKFSKYDLDKNSFLNNYFNKIDNLKLDLSKAAICDNQILKRDCVFYEACQLHKFRLATDVILAIYNDRIEVIHHKSALSPIFPSLKSSTSSALLLKVRNKNFKIKVYFINLIVACHLHERRRAGLTVFRLVYLIEEVDVKKLKLLCSPIYVTTAIAQISKTNFFNKKSIIINSNSFRNNSAIISDTQFPKVDDTIKINDFGKINVNPQLKDKSELFSIDNTIVKKKLMEGKNNKYLNNFKINFNNQMQSSILNRALNKPNIPPISPNTLPINSSRVISNFSLNVPISVSSEMSSSRTSFISSPENFNRSVSNSSSFVISQNQKSNLKEIRFECDTKSAIEIVGRIGSLIKNQPKHIEYIKEQEAKLSYLT